MEVGGNEVVRHIDNRWTYVQVGGNEVVRHFINRWKYVVVRGNEVVRHSCIRWKYRVEKLGLHRSLSESGYVKTIIVNHLCCAYNAYAGGSPGGGDCTRPRYWKRPDEHYFDHGRGPLLPGTHG